MYCGNCGAQLPEGARFCGSCGQPLVDPSKIDAGSDQQPEVQKFFTQPESAQEPFVRGQGNGYPDPYDDGFAPAPEPRKPKKIGWIIGAAAALVVIVAAVLVALNFKVVSNAWMRTFSSPESYYRHVEKQAMADVIDTGVDVYERTPAEHDSYTSEVTTKIVVGEPVRELAESLVGLDMDWLESAGLWEKVTMHDGKMGLQLDVSLNESSIATADLVTDGEDIYFRVPDIRDDYARIDQRDLMGGGAVSVQSTRVTLLELAQNLPEIMPDSDRMEKMLNRYVEAIVDNIDDVDKTTQTLQADTVSQKCTALTVHLDEDSLARIIEALCDTALEDEELQQILMDLVEQIGQDPDEVWDELVEELEDVRDRADRIAEQVEIEMTVYVDGKGEIRGRTIVINDYETLEYAAPEQGSNYGLRLALTRDDFEQFVLEGSGKNDSGSFELLVEEMHILDITASDFDRDALEDGYLNGTFDIAPSPFVVNQLGNEVGQELRGLNLDLDDVHLVVEARSKKDSGSIVLRVMMGEEEYLSVNMDSSVSYTGGEVDIPEDSISLENWTRNINISSLDVYLDRLEDAGFPSSLIRRLVYGIN